MPKKAKAKAKRARRINHKAAFLAAFVLTGGHVGKSAEAAGIRREVHYDWLERDPQYKQRFKRAKRHAIRTLIDEAIRRAFHGTRKVVYYQGEPIDIEFEYSDDLLMFLLKGLAPRIFRERFEHSGPGGSPIAVDIIAELTAGRERVAALRRNESSTSAG